MRERVPIRCRALQGSLSRHFIRRRACHVKGGRKTGGVRHHHTPGALAAHGFTNGTHPFFAKANIPPINASRRSSLPRFRKSSAKVGKMVSKAPSLRWRWKTIYGRFDMADIVATYLSRELWHAKSTKFHSKWPVVHCSRVRLALSALLKSLAIRERVTPIVHW